MAKILTGQKAQEFKNFLETNILKTTLKSFRPFRGGNSSYCFFVETEQEKWVAKIILKEPKINMLKTYLEEKIDICPMLCGIKMDKFFEYQGKKCTLQKNYGKPLPRRPQEAPLIAEIFKHYSKIVDLATNAKILDTQNITNKKQEMYNEATSNLSQRTDLKAKIISHFLQKIPPQTLEYNPQKLRVIHGDFNNNQVLLQNNKLTAFIDWDSLRAGYPTEDIWEFIYFNLRRLYNPFTIKPWTNRLVSEIIKVTDYSFEEWQTAINSERVSQLHRLTYNFKLKYLTKFLYLYYTSSLALKKIKG